MKTFKIMLFFAIIVLLTTTTTAQKTHKEYYDNGNLKTEGQFDSNGKGTGLWKSYYENGELESTGSYTICGSVERRQKKRLWYRNKS